MKIINELLGINGQLIKTIDGVCFWFYPADGKRKYSIIITDGMRNFDMPIPEKINVAMHCEIYICLPDYWPEDFNTSENKNYNWPMQWLEKIATLPRKKNTWFANGHSFPAQPLCPLTSQEAFILSETKTLEEMFTIEKQLEISLYVIIPIYEKELKYKLKNGAPKFLEKFFKSYNEKVDLQRKPMIHKKWGLI